jgi:16S rRNA (uracil1498-N3)-methyltransferase
MPADRFIFEGPLTENITISGAEFHHLKVMRIAIGEEVEIINGKGAIATGTLTKMDKAAAHFTLNNIQVNQKLPAHRILGIPLMRPNKLEWIIEKGTELGADAFYLYPADHSEKMQLSSNQLERLHHITVSAVKQSGRLFLPSFEIFTSFKELFATEGTILYGDVNPTAPSLLQVPITQTVLFISGPERGFSEKEDLLLAQKAKGVSLNPHILRAETAPIAAVSVLSLRN